MKRSMCLAFVLFAACGDDGDSKPDATVAPAPLALAVSGDFNMTGVLSKLDLTTMEVAQNLGGAGAVAGDPVLRRLNSRVYVVNRSGGNSVTVFDAKTLAFVDQFGTGAGSNPQDVAVAGKSLYLPSLGTSGVVKVDTESGATTTIDLATMVGDPDGLPDCVSAFAVGAKVYVACGLLDENYTPRGPGKVAVIDTNTDTVTTVVTLPTPNPYNFIEPSPATSVFGGDLLVPLLPSFTDYSTGCIARLSTGPTPTATCAAGLHNSDIAGNVIHMDVAADGGTLWMAVGTLDSMFMNPTGKLKGFDLTTGSLTAAVSPPSQLVQDVAACSDGSVVVSDGTFSASGLRVYKDAVEVTSAPLPIGLAPTFGNALVCYNAAQP